MSEGPVNLAQACIAGDGRKGLTLERLARIKVLHEEFKREGMLDASWGHMAHEHRTELLNEVDRLRDALSKIQWQTNCGCDSIDPHTRQLINHPDLERDAMYRIATEAIGPSRTATQGTRS